MKFKKVKTKYAFWTSGEGQNKTLFVRQEGDIRVVPLQAGAFHTQKKGDTGCDVLFTDRVILSLENEAEAKRAIKRLNGALKARKKSREWIALAAVATMFVVGMTFATAYSTSIGLRQQSFAAAPITPPAMAQQTPPSPPPSPAGWVDPKTIPTATRWSFGNPKGQPIYVFSDPQCPHCKELERALSGLKKEYLIQVYPTPRLGDDSAALIAQFACDADPAGAWSKWMASSTLNSKVEIKENCSSAGLAAADVNRKFMDQYNLLAVPTIIRQDGSVHMGSMDENSLRQWLQNKEISKVAQSTCGS